MKIIPKKIKIKNTIWKNYSLLELCIALVIFIVLFLMFTSDQKIISLILGGIFLILYLPVGDDLFYIYVLEIIIYIFKKKKYSNSNIKKIINIKNIDNEAIIEYNNNTYSKVIKIGQKNFLLEDEEQQEIDIESLSNAFKNIELGTIVDIIKIDRPLNFNNYIDDLDKKLNNEEIGTIKYKLLEARYNYLKNIHIDSKEYYSNFYIVIYNNKKENIELVIDSIISEITKCGLSIECLNKKETALFLKYNFNRNFDEEDINNIEEGKIIDWILPKEIKFNTNKYYIDGQELSTFTISDYPLKVKNGWGGELFNIPNTKVVMTIKPVEKFKAIKKIDSCILELQTKELMTNSTSQTKDAEIHSSTMVELLNKLQSENESLLDVSINISCYNYNKNNNYKRNVKNKVKTLNFKTNLLTYKQEEAFINSTCNVNKKNTKYERSINSISLASFFPFIKNFIMDKKGILLGKLKSNNHPFILDIWKRGELYQNSNGFVIGKSGSGKTYFLKTLLVNEWSNNTRIIICDPEAEYLSITRKLDGNIIDVGNAKEGMLNPFHIYQILTEEGKNASSQITFNTHLKTLESFFKIVLSGVSNDVIELINTLVIDMYSYKGITEDTNCIGLKANEYPLFSDLMIILEEKMKKEKDKFILEKYSIAKLHLNKFIKGRYSDIWNNPSTLQVDANIINFNFQSLFANKNNVVANAQMLLVFRFIEQEIINARERNRNGNNDKTIIVVDEAHLFIDPNYPIALDFFYQMNKRIRKYNGSFIPSTQNISDWNSNEELRHKTSTILKNSQYSFIFKLSSPDMQDVIEIYKSGESFNKEERKLIISATTGQSFFIGSSELRESVKIEANEVTKSLFD